jgi:hypothetical protein
MESAKFKIKNTVDTYIKLNPEEYGVFKEFVKQQRHALKDEHFGVSNDSNYMRALYEMPVTLHDMITNALNIDELEWFKSGGEDRKQGGRWFANTFPTFRLPDAV